MPTFRTDNWPTPVGMNYSPEAKRSSEEKIKVLREIAKRQAIERKIRQMQIDLPALERDLNKGDAKGQIESKISRLEAILNEFEQSVKVNENGRILFTSKVPIILNDESQLVL